MFHSVGVHCKAALWVQTPVLGTLEKYRGNSHRDGEYLGVWKEIIVLNPPDLPITHVGHQCFLGKGKQITEARL